MGAIILTGAHIETGIIAAGALVTVKHPRRQRGDGKPRQGRPADSSEETQMIAENAAFYGDKGAETAGSSPDSDARNVNKNPYLLTASARCLVMVGMTVNR